MNFPGLLSVPVGQQATAGRRRRRRGGGANTGGRSPRRRSPSCPGRRRSSRSRNTGSDPGALALGGLWPAPWCSGPSGSPAAEEGRRAPRGRASPVPGACFGVYMVALNWGEQRVDAGTASMIVENCPGPHRGARRLAAARGFPASPGGRAGRVVRGRRGRRAVGVRRAAALRCSASGPCLLAAVSYAVPVVSQKPALRHASALQVTTLGRLIGTAGHAAVRGPAGVRRPPPRRCPRR